MAATVAGLAARALRRLGVAAVAASERPAAATSATVPLDTVALDALRWIGVVAADETPAPADMALARDKVRAANEAQVAAGNASWTADAIPLAVSEDMTMLAVLGLGPAFGKGASEGADAFARIEARIRRASMLARAQGLAEEAVMAVHSWLSARGLARWTVFDIPDYAEDPYVALAANRLAPAFEVAPDQLAEVRAMRELFETTALPSSGERVAAAYF